jgi:diguanylate cyclase (GGDEF)-like protein
LERKRPTTRQRLDRALDRTFAEADHPGRIDPFEAKFRLSSVWTGAWMTLLVCIPTLIYGLSGGGKDDRALYWAVWSSALIGGLIAFILRWRRIIRSRWREAAFLAWTILDLLLLAGAIISDGGPESPLTILIFGPIIIVGVSYPTSSVKFVGALCLAGYTAFAVAYGEPFGRATVVLMIIDLDDFKSYNDSHGHIVGDELLVWTAGRIRSTLRPADSLARIGGDEFAVLVAGADKSASEQLAKRIQAACADRAPHCTGIASAPADGNDFDSLYRAADRALYEAKRERGSRLGGQLGIGPSRPVGVGGGRRVRGYSRPAAGWWRGGAVAGGGADAGRWRGRGGGGADAGRWGVTGGAPGPQWPSSESLRALGLGRRSVVAVRARGCQRRAAHVWAATGWGSRSVRPRFAGPRAARPGASAPSRTTAWSVSSGTWTIELGYMAS